MRDLLLLLVLLVGASTLGAQIFGPVAVPVTERDEARRNRSVLSIEGNVGANLVTRRKLLNDRFQVDGLTPSVGWQVGVQLVFFPESNVGILLGFEGINDRGGLTNYAKSISGDGFGAIEFDPEGHRIRVGDVSIDEYWLRMRLGLRFAIGKFLGETSFQVSSLLGGSQQYDYEETTRGFFDLVTNRLVLLEEPITRQGSRNFIGNNLGGYGGLYFGLSYPVTDRLLAGVNYEQGWHLSQSSGIDEWRQRRSRLGVGFTYLLAHVGRKQ